MNLLEECPPLVSSPALNYPESLLAREATWSVIAAGGGDDDEAAHREREAREILLAAISNNFFFSPHFQDVGMNAKGSLKYLRKERLTHLMRFTPFRARRERYLEKCNSAVWDPQEKLREGLKARGPPSVVDFPRLRGKT